MRCLNLLDNLWPDSLHSSAWSGSGQAGDAIEEDTQFPSFVIQTAAFLGFWPQTDSPFLWTTNSLPPTSSALFVDSWKQIYLNQIEDINPECYFCSYKKSWLTKAVTKVPCHDFFSSSVRVAPSPTRWLRLDTHCALWAPFQCGD